MYPYLRLAGILLRARFQPTLSPLDESELRLRVWMGDIDLYPELNNGRHQTMMDLGRMDLAARSGVLAVIRRRGWGLVVGGANLRYRRRIPFMSSFVLRTKWVGADERWMYFHQRSYVNGEICSAGIVKAGVTSRQGLVSPAELLAALGLDLPVPPCPEWVNQWQAAESMRPWPGSGAAAAQESGPSREA